MQAALDIDLVCRVTGMSAEEAQHNTHVLINAFDAGHHVVFWNRACEEYFGIPASAAVGAKLEELLPETKTDERISWLDRCLAGQEIHLLNGEFQRRRGKYEQKIIPAKDAEGRICAAVNIVTPYS